MLCPDRAPGDQRRNAYGSSRSSRPMRRPSELVTRRLSAGVAHPLTQGPDLLAWAHRRHAELHDLLDGAGRVRLERPSRHDAGHEAVAGDRDAVGATFLAQPGPHVAQPSLHRARGDVSMHHVGCEGGIALVAQPERQPVHLARDIVVDPLEPEAFEPPRGSRAHVSLEVVAIHDDWPGGIDTRRCLGVEFLEGKVDRAGRWAESYSGRGSTSTSCQPGRAARSLVGTRLRHPRTRRRGAGGAAGGRCSPPATQAAVPARDPTASKQRVAGSSAAGRAGKAARHRCSGSPTAGNPSRGAAWRPGRATTRGRLPSDVTSRRVWGDHGPPRFRPCPAREAARRRKEKKILCHRREPGGEEGRRTGA